jgi:ABC-type multidrug transport system ATPase subunit
MNQLRARELGKRFGSQLIFRNLSFTLEEGMILGVIGANGSGKSTLLRILAGIIPPNAGEVILRKGGERVSTDDRPLHTGFVAPYLQVYRAFSARENLQLQARMRGVGDVEDRIRRVFARVGLTARADDIVQTYSSGMYQRLRLASALLSEPVLLLLDEPFSNLDKAGRETVDRVMDEQSSRGTLQVMATNTVQVTERCDRVVSVEDYK